MSFKRTNAAAKSIGLYRVARWVNCHVFDREELARRKADEAFYRQIIRPGDLAFDAGANYGGLTSLGRISINFSPSEELQFVLPQWLSAEEFDSFYPAKLQHLPGCEGYGDIFVRNEPTNAQ